MADFRSPNVDNFCVQSLCRDWDRPDLQFAQTDRGCKELQEYRQERYEIQRINAEDEGGS